MGATPSPTSSWGGARGAAGSPGRSPTGQEMRRPASSAAAFGARSSLPGIPGGPAWG